MRKQLSVNNSPNQQRATFASTSTNLYNPAALTGTHVDTDDDDDDTDDTDDNGCENDDAGK